MNYHFVNNTIIKQQMEITNNITTQQNLKQVKPRTIYQIKQPNQH